MKTFVFALLVASSPLFIRSAYAQRAFQIGPTGGATYATQRILDPYSSADVRHLRGFEAGALANWQRIGHWGAQAAVLYTQQGYRLAYYNNFTGSTATDDVRLNYLRLPLRVVFTQHTSGQGIQLFAGPYAGVLLGGTRSYLYPYNNYSFRSQVLVASDYGRDSTWNRSAAYSRRLDAGLQGGVGYRLGNALLQVGYTLGLVNVAATRYQAYVEPVNNPARTRSWQASLTYLLGTAR
jgi:hypothetical protein